MPSSFKKNTRTIPIPVTVPNGGTGRTSLASGGILVGAGTGDVSIIPPGLAGEAIVSDGYGFKSGGIAPADGSVTSAKIGSDLSGISSISAMNVDWSSSSIFTKILDTNTVFTFSNYQLNKVITLIIKGNYFLSFPKSVKIINGVYNGATTNYITLHCIKSTAPEEVWAVVNNKFVDSKYFYGYFVGGYTTVGVVTSDRILFSTGVTSASTVSNLPTATYELAGLSDSSTYGYFAGGYTGGVSVATTNRIVFSTNILSANTVSNLSQAQASLIGLSDGVTNGYFTGTSTNRIVFSTGVTSANTISNLSQARDNLASVSDDSSYGYFAGGASPSLSVITDRIVFSTGVTSLNTVSNLSQARNKLAGLSDNMSYGYFAGGSSGAFVATADRIVFSTGVTSANTVSNLSVVKYGLGGVSDGLNFGYFAGGNSATYVATSDRIIFATGVTSANTVSNLSQARYYLSGLSGCSV